jgi:hypothetical protein
MLMVGTAAESHGGSLVYRSALVNRSEELRKLGDVQYYRLIWMDSEVVQMIDYTVVTLVLAPFPSPESSFANIGDMISFGIVQSITMLPICLDLHTSGLLNVCRPYV